MTTFEVFTPSATMFMSAMISSMDLPLPSCSPTWRLRLCGLMQVAMRSPMPARPAKVSCSPPMRDAEAGELGEAAGDDRGAGVVAGAEPVGHARRDGDHVLQHPAELAADDVLVRVHPEERRWRTAAAGAQATLWSSMAITLAAGVAGQDLLGQVRAR